MFNEYGDEVPVNVRFTADRISRILTMTDYDADGTEQVMTLDGKKISTLLRWTVHSLEIFMWVEDYDLDPLRNSIPPLTQVTQASYVSGYPFGYSETLVGECPKPPDRPLTHSVEHA